MQFTSTPLLKSTIASSLNDSGYSESILKLQSRKSVPFHFETNLNFDSDLKKNKNFISKPTAHSCNRKIQKDLHKTRSYDQLSYSSLDQTPSKGYYSEEENNSTFPKINYASSHKRFADVTIYRSKDRNDSKSIRLPNRFDFGKNGINNEYESHFFKQCQSSTSYDGLDYALSGHSSDIDYDLKSHIFCIDNSQKNIQINLAEILSEQSKNAQMSGTNNTSTCEEYKSLDYKCMKDSSKRTNDGFSFRFNNVKVESLEQSFCGERSFGHNMVAVKNINLTKRDSLPKCISFNLPISEPLKNNAQDSMAASLTSSCFQQKTLNENIYSIHTNAINTNSFKNVSPFHHDDELSTMSAKPYLREPANQSVPKPIKTSDDWPRLHFDRNEPAFIPIKSNQNIDDETKTTRDVTNRDIGKRNIKSSRAGPGAYSCVEKYTSVLEESKRVVITLPRLAGVDAVDILFELMLRNAADVLAKILYYLDDSDLIRVCCVSHNWNNCIEQQMSVYQRKLEFLRCKRLQANSPNKENCSWLKRLLSCDYTSSTQGPMGEVQPVKAANIPRLSEPRQNKAQTFWMAAKDLESGQKLLKCIRCEYASKPTTTSFPILYACTRITCLLRFCSNCHGVVIESKEFHRCPVKTIITKPETISTKKSKWNLRRL